MDEAFEGIANAVMGLTRALRRAGLDGGYSIELLAREDVDRFKSLSMLNAKPWDATFARSRAEMKTELAGVEIHGPAQFRPLKRGFDVE